MPIRRMGGTAGGGHRGGVGQPGGSVELATAYVSIMPETSKLAPGVRRAATEAGQALNTQISGAMQQAFSRAETYASGFAGHMASANLSMRRGMDSLVNSVENVTGAEQRLDRVLQNKKSTAADVEAAYSQVRRSHQQLETSIDSLGVKAASWNRQQVSYANQQAAAQQRSTAAQEREFQKQNTAWQRNLRAAESYMQGHQTFAARTSAAVNKAFTAPSTSEMANAFRRSQQQMRTDLEYTASQGENRWRRMNASMALANLGGANSMRQSIGGALDEMQGKAARSFEGMRRGMLDAFGAPLGVRATTAGAGLLAGYAAFSGVDRVLSGGFQRLQTIQNAQVAMTTILGDQKQAMDLVKQVSDAAVGTPYGADTFLQMARNLVTMGVQTNQVLPSIRALGDAAGVMGRSPADMEALSREFGKIKAEGRLMGRDVYELQRVGGINAREIIANHLGMTGEELTKQMGQKGGLNVDADEIIQTLITGIEQGSTGTAGTTPAYGGGMEKQRNTVTGALNVLKSQADRIGASFLQPFFDRIPGAVDRMTDKFRNLTQENGPIAQFSNRLANLGGGNLFDKIIGGLPNLITGPINLANRLMDVLQTPGAQRAIGLLKSDLSGIFGVIRDLAPTFMRLGGTIAQGFGGVALSGLTLFKDVLVGIAGPLKAITGFFADNKVITEGLIGIWAALAIKGKAVEASTRIMGTTMGAFSRQVYDMNTNTIQNETMWNRMATSFRGAKGDADGLAGTLRGSLRAGMTGLSEIGGGLMGAFGGPWGLAITGATTLLGFLAAAHQSAANKAAAQKQAELELQQAIQGTLDKESGRVTEETRSKAAQRLGDTGSIAEAKRLGLDPSLLVDVATGTGGPDSQAMIMQALASKLQQGLTTGPAPGDMSGPGGTAPAGPAQMMQTLQGLGLTSDQVTNALLKQGTAWDDVNAKINEANRGKTREVPGFVDPDILTRMVQTMPQASQQAIALAQTVNQLNTSVQEGGKSQRDLTEAQYGSWEATQAGIDRMHNLGAAIQAVPKGDTIIVSVDPARYEAFKATMEEAKYTVERLPDGSVKVTANTDEAKNDFASLVERINQTQAQLNIRLGTQQFTADLQQWIARVQSGQEVGPMPTLNIPGMNVPGVPAPPPGAAGPVPSVATNPGQPPGPFIGPGAGHSTGGRFAKGGRFVLGRGNQISSDFNKLVPVHRFAGGGWMTADPRGGGGTNPDGSPSGTGPFGPRWNDTDQWSHHAMGPVLGPWDPGGKYWEEGPTQAPGDSGSRIREKWHWDPRMMPWWAKPGGGLPTWDFGPPSKGFAGGGWMTGDVAGSGHDWPIPGSDPSNDPPPGWRGRPSNDKSSDWLPQFVSPGVGPGPGSGWGPLQGGGMPEWWRSVIDQARASGHGWGIDNGPPLPWWMIPFDPRHPSSEMPRSGRGSANARGGRFAGGARMIRGPGTGTSDSIPGLVDGIRPILVSHGESINTAKSTAYNWPVIDAMNKGATLHPGILRMMGVRGFADGGGLDAAYQTGYAMNGKPYANTFGDTAADCSGFVSMIVNAATGIAAGGGPRMTTQTAGAWLQAHGAVIGTPPGPGFLTVGWYNHGSGVQDGHMAGTMPNGTNFEAGGPNGGVQFGGAAHGALDPEFEQHAWFPYTALYPDGTVTIPPGSPATTPYGSMGAGGGGGGAGGYFPHGATPRQIDTLNAQLGKAGEAVTNTQHDIDIAQQHIDDLKSRKTPAPPAEMSRAEETLRRAQAAHDDAITKQGTVQNQLAAAQAAGPSTGGGGAGAGAGGAGGKNGVGADLGKTIVDGMFQSLGIDGSVFSDPRQWTGVKSMMALMNWFMKPLSSDSVGSSMVGLATGAPGYAAPAPETATNPRDQMADAIVRTGMSMGMGPNALKSGLMASLQESGLDPKASNKGHEGLFQMDSAKGTLEQRQDPNFAANWFFSQVANIPGHETMDPGQLAEAVEKSGVGAAYGPHSGEAASLLQNALGRIQGTRQGTGGPGPGPGNFGPVPASATNPVSGYNNYNAAAAPTGGGGIGGILGGVANALGLNMPIPNNGQGLLGPYLQNMGIGTGSGSGSSPGLYNPNAATSGIPPELQQFAPTPDTTATPAPPQFPTDNSGVDDAGLSAGANANTVGNVTFNLAPGATLGWDPNRTMEIGRREANMAVNKFQNRSVVMT